MVLPSRRYRLSNHVSKITGTIFAFFILNSHTLATAEDGFVRYPPLPKKESSKIEIASPKSISSNDRDAELESRGYVFFPPRETAQSASQSDKVSEKRTVEPRIETRAEISAKNPKTDKETIEPAKSADRLVITPNVNRVPIDNTRGNVVTTSSTQVTPVRVSPTIEFKFDEKTKAQFSENHSAIQYRDTASETSAGIQITRDSLGNTYLTGRAGAILNKHIATGTHFSASDRRQDLNLSAVVSMNSNRIQIRSTVGIMKGTQGANFESGYSDVDLQQVSKLLALNYLPTLSDSQILELIGVNIWDSRATQLSTLDGIYITRETPTSYDTYYDPRRLSEGRIAGASGKVKLRIHDRLRIEQSLGRERLYFPFSDGTFEESYKLYSDTVLKANIGDKSLLTMGISSGAYERKARFELSYDGFVFSFLDSQGLSGQKDYWAAGVQYNLLPFKNSETGIRTKKSTNLNLTTASALLETVSSRPIEFPHTFTVKTDPTSVRLVSSITKGTITWQSSGILGTFFDSATPSRQNISIQLQSTNSSGYAVEYDTTLVSGSLPPGLTLNASGVISGTASAVTSDTTYTFQVKAKSSGASDLVSTALSIIIKAPSSITWASSGSLGTFFDVGTPSRNGINLQLSALSSTGDTVTYNTILVSGSLPPGLSLNSSGAIVGTASAVATDTTYTFKVSASSPNSGSASSADLSITIKAPVLVKFITSGATILSGSPTVSSNSVTFPAELTNAKVVLAGGGGGGGNGDGGGGGGAGALLINTSFVLGGQFTYSISIGRGGVGGGATGTCGAGEDGGSTAFGSIVALGGGGGGCSNPDYAGRSGGSGGGASQDYAGGNASGSCGQVISGFSYLCNAGGSGNKGGTYRAGGGGGAGSAGTSGTDTTPGNGGAGYLLSSDLGGGYVSGGGGGGNGVANYPIASGGSGVGGNAGSGNGSSATANTGSGGGGGGVLVSDSGGDGSDGFVIIGY